MPEASSSSASYSSPSSPFGLENNNDAIDYHNKELGYIFSSSKVQATFGSGENGNGGRGEFTNVLNVTINPTTPMGDEIVLKLTNKDDDSDFDDVVTIRLIIIKPNQDWRINQNYNWKLDNAWMKLGVGADDRSNHNWLHWNVQSYVNSVIQIPTSTSNNDNNNDADNNTIGNNVFVTPHMEFHFNPILANGLPRGKPDQSNKLILKDVRLGAHLSTRSNDDDNNIVDYNPCKSNSCSIVDGVVVTDTTTASTIMINLESSPYYEIGEIVLAATLLSGAFLWIFYYICYGRTRKLSRSNYEQVGMSEEEEEDEEEADEELESK